MANSPSKKKAPNAGETMRAVFADTLRLRLNPGKKCAAPNTAADAAASEYAAAFAPSATASLMQFSWTSTAIDANNNINNAGDCQADQ